MPLPIGMVAAAGAASAAPCLAGGCSYSQAVMPGWGRAEGQAALVSHGCCCWRKRINARRAQVHLV